MQIAFMPYLGKFNLTFGGFDFRPYHKIRNIFDQKVREHLDWYLEKHVDSHNKSLPITLVGVGGDFFGPWGEEIIQNMYNLAAILAFFYIWTSHPQVHPICSENFNLYIKDFDIAKRNFSTSTGTFIQMNKMYSTDFAQKVKFIVPEEIPLSTMIANMTIDESFLDALSQAVVKAQSEQWLRRIVRSMKIYNVCVSNTNMLSWLDRALLLVTAVSSLFEERTDDKNRFANTIVNYIGTGNVETDSRLKSIFSKVYEIRSRYSHGQGITAEDLIHPEYGDLIIGTLYSYGLIIKSILRKNEFLLTKDLVSSHFFILLLFDRMQSAIREDEDA